MTKKRKIENILKLKENHGALKIKFVLDRWTNK